MSAGWRVFLWAAAAYNLVIGAGGFLAPEAGIDDRTIAVLVLSFGVLYAVVAYQPVRLAPALWAGVVGKAGVVALLLPGALAADDTAIATILVGDALFLIGFLAILLGPSRHWKNEGETG